MTAAERNGVRLICVTLNAPDDWDDHRKMLNYGFEQVKPTEIVLPNPVSVPVIGGYEQDVTLVLRETVKLPLSEQESSTVRVELYTEPFLYAGFAAGSRAGSARIYLGGRFVSEVELVTSYGVKSQEQEPGFWSKLWQFLRRFVGV